MNALAANETAWDYVVVGAGSAGCAVAGRLSESGRFRVLLLEAGEDDPWLWLKVPLGAGFVLLSQRSLWRFYTEPEANLDGRRVFWPRGRVLGGSSSINGMLWVRGEPAEFEHWRELGNPGWGYADVLPVLKRMEAYGEGDAAVRGKSGPVHINRFSRSTLAEAFHAACVATGVPATPAMMAIAVPIVERIRECTHHLECSVLVMARAKRTVFAYQHSIEEFSIRVLRCPSRTYPEIC